MYQSIRIHEADAYVVIETAIQPGIIDQFLIITLYIKFFSRKVNTHSMLNYGLKSVTKLMCSSRIQHI